MVISLSFPSFEYLSNVYANPSFLFCSTSLCRFLLLVHQVGSYIWTGLNLEVKINLISLPLCTHKHSFLRACNNSQSCCCVIYLAAGNSTYATWNIYAVLYYLLMLQGKDTLSMDISYAFSVVMQTYKQLGRVELIIGYKKGLIRSRINEYIYIYIYICLKIRD